MSASFSFLGEKLQKRIIMKQQVICLNGWVPKENFKDYYDFLEKITYNPYGENFKNWNKTLWEYLGAEYEYWSIPFPNKEFADYKAWKIVFEKMLPYISENAIFIANSLGCTFLLKYMGEENFSLRLKKVFFLAPALHDSRIEVLWTFSFDIELVYARVARFCKKIYIYHSQDDTIVPFTEWLELKSYFPEAIFREFYDRGHFFLEARIPELEEDIKN